MARARSCFGACAKKSSSRLQLMIIYGCQPYSILSVLLRKSKKLSTSRTPFLTTYPPARERERDGKRRTDVEKDSYFHHQSRYCSLLSLSPSLSLLIHLFFLFSMSASIVSLLHIDLFAHGLSALLLLYASRQSCCLSLFLIPVSDLSAVRHLLPIPFTMGSPALRYQKKPRNKTKQKSILFSVPLRLVIVAARRLLPAPELFFYPRKSID